MSRDVAGTSPPLSAELLSAAVYKPNQGRLVRQVTCLVVWIVVALGCWRLHVWLNGRFGEATWAEFAVPGGLLLGGFWLGFRVVNWPRFADFLIAVEAELAKVSWPSKTELIRASIVVIFTIFFLASILFLFDIIWQTFFRAIGVTV